jgi:hypothetical protein
MLVPPGLFATVLTEKPGTVAYALRFGDEPRSGARE